MVYQAAMARIAQTIAVSPQMYRHFAVITVTVTAFIAFFADGERREEISDHISAQQARAEAKRTESKKLEGKILHRAKAANRAYGGSSGGDFVGEGMIQGAAASPGTRRPYNSRPPGSISPEIQIVGATIDNLPDVRPPDMPADVYARLKSIQQQRRTKQGPDQATASDLRRIDRISAQNSGVESDLSD